MIKMNKKSYYSVIISVKETNPQKKEERTLYLYVVPVTSKEKAKMLYTGLTQLIETLKKYKDEHPID
jgi:hypothetical protein